MQGLHLADTHGFALPMTDAAKPRQSMMDSGKQIYGPNSLKNDSAINIIESTWHPSVVDTKKATRVPAAGVKATKLSREKGPWNGERESRPLPHNSLAGIPRPQFGDKYALVDKHRIDANKRRSEPLRERAIGLLQNEKNERRLKQSEHGLEGDHSQAEPTQETLNPVQVLPAFDESGWMVAPTPDYNAAAASESPEVGVPVKTVDQQPVSSQTQEQAERLNSRATTAGQDTQEPVPEVTAYAPNTQAQASDAAASEAAALEIASRDAAARESRVREKVSNDIASLETATRNAKEREDAYRATAERRIEQYGLATREANTNAMIGMEAANQQHAAAAQPFSSTGVSERQQSNGGASSQTSGAPQATPRDQENYERAVHLDEYNRFRNATGIGKPPEPLSYQRGQSENVQAAQPGSSANPTQPQESFRETLKIKAKKTRHQFLDKVFRRNKPSKKAEKEAKRLGKRSNNTTADDDRGAGSSADTGAEPVGNVTNLADAQGGNQPPRKGVIAAEKAEAGQGLSQAAPPPLGRSIRQSSNDRPMPAQNVSPLQAPYRKDDSDLNQPASGYSSNQLHSATSDTAADNRAHGANIPVATTSQANPPPHQVPYTADPAAYNVRPLE
ncbi:hypothetical protein KEM54_004073 [Ascosphaera aggregata]|nr:hypothetical protein KEM54_004073 [Ascosphaera aggregata]